MPLYEYECEACGQRFELIRRFSDPPVDVCALCGKGPVARLLSSPAIQFKGSGWYITDYAKKKGEGGKADAGTREGSQGDGSTKDSGTTTDATAGASSDTAAKAEARKDATAKSDSSAPAAPKTAGAKD